MPVPGAAAWRVTAVHRRTAADTDYDGCFATTGTVQQCEARFELQASRLALEYEGRRVQPLSSLSLKPILIAKDRALAVPVFTSASTIQHWEYIGNATGLRGVDLVFGLELEKEQDAGNARDNEGYYMELLSDFSDRFFINAGARHDRNSDYGSHTSYRIGSAWLLANRWRSAQTESELWHRVSGPQPV